MPLGWGLGRDSNNEISGDVYLVESIVSYQYHKTDAVSYQNGTNDTFNDTFMMILIRIELV